MMGQKTVPIFCLRFRVPVPLPRGIVGAATEILILFVHRMILARTPKWRLLSAPRRGERTPLACSFRRPAENLMPLTFSCGEES